MELRTLRDWASTQFEFPADRSTVLATAGDVEIEAPDPSASETVATVLERTDEPEFGSPTHLDEVLRCNLSEAYVGRKYYDDRGSDPRPRTNGSGQRPRLESF